MNGEADYRIVSELDITGRSKKCVESPMVTLTRALAEIEEGEALLVHIDPDRTPPKALELLAKKRGFCFRLVESSEEKATCLIFRPASRS